MHDHLNSGHALKPQSTSDLRLCILIQTCSIIIPVQDCAYAQGHTFIATGMGTLKMHIHDILAIATKGR